MTGDTLGQTIPQPGSSVPSAKEKERFSLFPSRTSATGLIRFFTNMSAVALPNWNFPRPFGRNCISIAFTRVFIFGLHCRSTFARRTGATASRESYFPFRVTA